MVLVVLMLLVLLVVVVLVVLVGGVMGSESTHGGAKSTLNSAACRCAALHDAACTAHEWLH